MMIISASVMKSLIASAYPSSNVSTHFSNVASISMNSTCQSPLHMERNVNVNPPAQREIIVIMALMKKVRAVFHDLSTTKMRLYNRRNETLIIPKVGMLTQRKAYSS